MSRCIVSFSIPMTLADEARGFAASDAWREYVVNERDRKRDVMVDVELTDLDSFLLSLAAAADMAQIPSERRRWMKQVVSMVETLEGHSGTIRLPNTKNFLRL